MNKRIGILLGLLTLVALYFSLDLESFLNLAVLKTYQHDLILFYQQKPLWVISIYSISYIVIAALSLPGAAVMSLAGGALLGFWIGVPVVLLSASIGATLAFLASRYLFRGWVECHFGHRLQVVNQELQRDGIFYLLSLRLIPAIPFVVINLLMGLTTLPTLSFFWVSFVGMMAGTAVYVNAGVQLAAIDDLAEIFSPVILSSFLLLAIFPWLARWVIGIFKQRRLYARWKKPAQFDRNLIVIGAGAAGLVTAYIAATTRAKVTLIESHKMGGDCLNYGCVPSKALIRTAHFLAQIKKAQSLGIDRVSVDYQFQAIMARVQRVIETVAPHDSIERYTQLGVEVIQGKACITSPWTVSINDQTLSTRTIVIATGARPAIPDLPGLNQVHYYTSETIWSLQQPPKHLIVLGGGPVGCELAQAFARLAIPVTLIARDRLLMREDSEVSALIQSALQTDGVEILTQTVAIRCEVVNQEQRLLLRDQQGIETMLIFDALLCAVGREARITGFGLEELGIGHTPTGTIETNDRLQTIYPNIYACGDVVGPYQFTHVAAHQAWYAAVNALFGTIKDFKVDYRTIPWAIFTDPEVAHVGLSEQEARARKVSYEVTRFDLKDLDRAIADEAAYGFVNVLTVPGKDRILGVTIVAKHASDLITEFVFAMKHGLGLNKILNTIHTYPSWSEANKYAAGEWKRQHVNSRLLNWTERFHSWRRDGK